MSNQDHIQTLEAELEQAKRDAMPSVTIEVDHTQTEHVTKNLKTGTVRVDLINETLPPSPQPRVIEVSGKTATTELPPEAELLSDNGQERVMRLSSGTVRTDITRYEAPLPVNYWSA